MKKSTKCPHYLAFLCRVNTPEGDKVICECGWVDPDPPFGLLMGLPKARLKPGISFKDGKVVRDERR